MGFRHIIRRAAPRALALVIAAIPVGCGGIVVFDQAGDGGGGASSSDVSTSAATATGADSTSAVAATSVGTATSGGISTTVGTGTSVAASTSVASASSSDAASSGSGGACEGQPCGTFCQECPRCDAGHCDGAGSCIPAVFGTEEECPPVDEVVSGGACREEGYLCGASASCSGVLQCLCGQWTLIHPC